MTIPHGTAAPSCPTCDGLGYVERFQDLWRNGTHDTRDWTEDCPHPLCVDGKIDFSLADPCPVHGVEHLDVDTDGYRCVGPCRCPGMESPGLGDCLGVHVCECARCGRPVDACPESMSDERMEAIARRMDALAARMEVVDGG